MKKLYPFRPALSAKVLGYVPILFISEKYQKFEYICYCSPPNCKNQLCPSQGRDINSTKLEPGSLKKQKPRKVATRQRGGPPLLAA
jgi:hypothetical protein